MVSAIDLPLDDIIHIAPDGQQRLGRRLAEVALTKVYRLPGHAEPITLAAVEILNPAGKPKIRIRSSGVQGQLSAVGRPNGFVLRSNMPPASAPTIYRVDFDPDDQAALLLGAYNPIKEPVQLVYGSGLDPFANIVDEKDMPIPAFGPLPIPYLPARPDFDDKSPHPEAAIARGAEMRSPH